MKYPMVAQKHSEHELINTIRYINNEYQGKANPKLVNQ